MLQFAHVLSLSMGTCGRRFHRAFSVKLSVLEQNCCISRIVSLGNTTSELNQPQRRRKQDNKKTKKINKQNKNSEHATLFLCYYHMTLIHCQTC